MVDLTERFLAYFELLDFVGPFRSIRANIQLPESDPRGLAIAGVLLAMQRSGLEWFQLLMVSRYLCARAPAQLSADIVFLENGMHLGLPVEDRAELLDLQTMQSVSPADRPPRLTLHAWYCAQFMTVAQQLHDEAAQEADTDG